MAAHTPGPWKAVEFEDVGEVVDAKGYEVANLNVGLIAINREWLDENPDEHWSGHGPASFIERDISEVLANADLIAASPTMYDALVEAEGALAVKSSLRDGEQARVQAALEKVRAAITIATEAS